MDPDRYGTFCLLLDLAIKGWRWILDQPGWRLVKDPFVFGGYPRPDKI